MNEIDLVITWLDNTDPVWQKDLKHHSNSSDSSSYLFRNWGWMRYWFRSAEQNLPWIRRIHFVTYGHLPSWLDTRHPKLHIVNHADYIPSDYLPTFSSHTIEWNLHRIDDLSEQFILCNDDMFFLKPMPENDYFRNGLPCDVLHIRPVTESRSKSFHHLLLNNMACLNRHFDMHACAEQHPDLWFSEAYSEEIRLDNSSALRWNRFPGLFYDHMPMPLLKSGIAAVWEEEPELLDDICRRPLRDFYLDINIYLARFRTLAAGEFVPFVRPSGTYCLLSNSDKQITDILLGDTPLVCLNEAGFDLDFDKKRQLILSLLEKRFPVPSSFEKPVL